MISITKEELNKYLQAQKLQVYVDKFSGKSFAQTKYSIGRWKASGLDSEKYLYIADHENELIKKGNKQK